MRRFSVLVVACLALAVPAGASAATSFDIYDDCQDDGVLSGTYTNAEFRRALDEMPEDFREYESCDEQIEARLAGVDTRGGANDGARDGGPAGGGGVRPGGPRDLPRGNGVGSVPLGPNGKPLNPEIDAQDDERAALNAARTGAEPRPQIAGVAPGGADAPLPAALVVVLALAGAAALGAAALKLRRRLGSA